jgi:hypothetical protein
MCKEWREANPNPNLCDDTRTILQPHTMIADYALKGVRLGLIRQRHGIYVWNCWGTDFQQKINNTVKTARYADTQAQAIYLSKIL